MYEYTDTVVVYLEFGRSNVDVPTTYQMHTLNSGIYNGDI